jgi:four helix bundle protein
MNRAIARRAMSMQSDQLKERTMRFALDVLQFVDAFQRSIAGDLVGRQLAKSATSVAANYRATCASRSRAEFIAKLGVVFEEIDESEFWLNLALHRDTGGPKEAQRLHAESIELRAIFGRSLGTARSNTTISK